MYDFDGDLRRILRNQGVFAQLDRLAGSNLSVFYLHTARRGTVDQFNAVLLSKLGLIESAAPPCVVFFKLKDGGFEDVLIVQLESADIVHGFHELYRVIKNYINNTEFSIPSESKALRFIKGSTKFIALETFRAALKRIIEAVVSPY